MATNRGLEKLSATAVAKARHRAKPYKLADGGGLYSSIDAESSYRLLLRKRPHSIPLQPRFGGVFYFCCAR
jgi:hypothetical protein